LVRLLLTEACAAFQNQTAGPELLFCRPTFPDSSNP
jgi:hypothetical protein